MQSGPDALGAPPSLTARRSAAPQFNFELPPPPLAGLSNKYPSYASFNATQPSTGSGSVASVGNLLTPPNNVPGEVMNPAPMSSDTQATTTSQGNNNYNTNAFWNQAPQNSVHYGLPASNSSWMPQRNLLSPASMSSIVRGVASSQASANGVSSSAATNESYQLPPFPTSAASAPVTLPAMSTTQQQGANALGMTGQASSSSSAAQPSFNAQNIFGIRHPPTPSYANPSQPSPTPQQQSYPYSSSQSPSQSSPLGGSSHPSKSSSLGNTSDAQNMSAAAANQVSQSNSYPRPYGPYSSSLPTMNGPVMSNLHNPNTHMALVGNVPGVGNMSNGFMPPGGMMPNFTSGQAANLQHMYGPPNPAPPPNPTNERPFKCDQCPQSFNRNHDLKRHKRIHLAVKPYPCGHCDKSFSRKDALKVCIPMTG